VAAYSALSNPLGGFKGPTSMGRAGQGRGDGEKEKREDGE